MFFQMGIIGLSATDCMCVLCVCACIHALRSASFILNSPRKWDMTLSTMGYSITSDPLALLACQGQVDVGSASF